jgi:hypothetical protein
VSYIGFESESESDLPSRLTIYRQSVLLGEKTLETHYQNFHFPTERLLF